MKRDHVVDLKAIAWDAMEKYGFSPRFPSELMHDLKKINNYPQISTGKGITDLRHLLWSSIDNYDSMDLDQIEYCEPLVSGDILVKVAISDVDNIVSKYSHADMHALSNGTSVYTGVITFPMLPPKFSEKITSLLPGQDCMALIIEYTIHKDGNFTPGEIYRGIVSNKAKLVYEEIGDWLEGKKAQPQIIEGNLELKKMILLQNEAALRLKKHRMEIGALDFETIEVEVKKEGEIITDLVVQKQNTARNLIEEFMVAANRTIASFIEKAGFPMIQRVVRVPKYWNEIRSTVEKYGVSLPLNPDSKVLNEFLLGQKIKDPERFPDLSLTIVKLMGSGEYVSYIPGKELIGHFALGITDYTHGTAPNRRYVDLIIQRLIKSALDKKKHPYSIKELEEKAQWLTGREKAANKVERYMIKAAAAVLLKSRIGEEFNGFVTGASEKGTYVRITSPTVEGRIMTGETGLKVGQKVIVRLIKTDPYIGHLDFDFIKKTG